MTKENTKHNKVLKYLWIFIGVVAIIGSLFLPTKYYVEAPGGAYEVRQYFSIDQKTAAKNSGGFYFTAVSIRPALVFDYLFNFTRDFSELVPKEEIDGDNTSAEHQKIEQYYMKDSINQAVYLAAKKAKVPVSRKFEGIYVMSVLDNSSFKNKLQVGDLIKTANNRTFTSVQNLLNYFKNLSPKQKIKLVIDRNNRRLVFSGNAVKLDKTNRYGIGITLAADTSVTTTPAVKANIEDIGGPSAGLMFSLELYQELAGVNLTRGRLIAGTGTIDSSGHVGSIGGIDKKVVAADKVGATIFFAPNEKLPGMTPKTTNYAEAKRAANKLGTTMKIVPVSNFADALKYLTQH